MFGGLKEKAYLCSRRIYTIIKVMERLAAYTDYVVRVPQGEDISKLSSLTQSMGWIIVNKTWNVPKRRGLAGFRGILKTADSPSTSYEEMLDEALSDKYELEL